jgi:S-adenosyl-methyltransferase mraW
MIYEHKSVLLHETVDMINIKKGGIYVDATFGGGGHSRYMLSKEDDMSLYVFDQDIYAIDNGRNNFANDNRIHFVNTNFVNVKSALQDMGIYEIDGIIADLGVSSYQLDTAKRGFSYMKDAPLDMRMDTGSSLTARDIVNTYSRDELKRIIRLYSEEKWADKIATIIVETREKTPINTTFELVNVIERAIPKKLRDKNKHPAKRTFQAIRIETNNELGILEKFVNDAFDMLKIGGRMSIITFHSLEDRLIKNIYKNLVGGCICPSEFPVCMCGRTEKARIITKKPIIPTDEELQENARARSAKLRVIEKI